MGRLMPGAGLNKNDMVEDYFQYGIFCVSINIQSIIMYFLYDGNKTKLTLNYNKKENFMIYEVYAFWLQLNDDKKFNHNLTQTSVFATENSPLMCKG